MKTDTMSARPLCRESPPRDRDAAGDGSVAQRKYEMPSDGSPQAAIINKVSGLLVENYGKVIDLFRKWDVRSSHEIAQHSNDST